MKLLFITPYLPGPPIFGGQRRIHGLMTHLAQSHDVSVVALVDADLDLGPSLADTKSYCRHVVPVLDRWHRVSGKRKRLLQFASMLTPRSYERALYFRPRFQRTLDRHLREHTYDVIVCEFVFMTVYALRGGWTPRSRPRFVLDEHNIEFDLLQRTAESATRGRKVFNSVDAFKLRREEIAAWSRFDGCTVTSARDEAFVKREAPSVRTAVVPNGVDVDAFAPREGVKPEPLTLLFFGAINYFPNEDGALYFAERILPLIKERHPDVRFRIVGPVGPGPVMDLRKQGVEVKGFVDDLLPEIESAAVVVVPLRIGGGTRLKIIEAMAMGKPIVSSRIGAEGIDVEHEKDILLSDDPREFADHVCRVLGDPELAERLGRAARQTVVEAYSWRASAEKMEALFEELLEARPGEERSPAQRRPAPA